MDEAVRDELVKVVRAYGPDLANDGRKLRSLLSDRCPSMRKEVHALAAAAECRVATEISTTSTGLPWSATANRFVTKLVDLTAMDETAARWVVDSWGLALGKTSTVPMYQAAAPPRTTPQNAFDEPMSPPSTVSYSPPPPPPPPTPAVVHQYSLFNTDALFTLLGGLLWWGTIAYIVGAAIFRPTWFGSGVWIAAQCGLPVAQEYLAELHETGRKGAEIDPVKAAKWRAVVQKEKTPEELYRLAWDRKKGEGVPVDLTEARKLFKQAADAGYQEAEFQYAYMCCEGEGGPVDKAEARQWYAKPVERGDPIAMYNLALLCKNGEGGKVDLAAARQLYRRAADQGYAPAYYPIALMLDGGKGGPQEPDEAKILYERAIPHLEEEERRGDAGAASLLGIMHRDGKGKSKDPKEAVRYFRLAVDRGNVRSLVLLGDCYLNGEGVSKDPFEAVRLFRQAADKDDGAAMDCLGFCYEYGRGVDKNREEAIRWYRKAVEAGDPDAQEHLDKLLK